MSISLYDSLKSSYGDKKATNKIINDGYKLDGSLSSHNQTVFYNPTSKKLLYNIAGTHNINDWGTDFYLGMGKLKDTNRYKEADNILKQAKQKYGDNISTTITGHSLGGTIAQGISKKDDKLFSLNAGYTIGQKTRNKGHNKTNLRTSGDIVSLFGSNAKNIKSLQNNNLTTNNLLYDVLASHNVDNIKHDKIFV